MSRDGIAGSSQRRRSGATAHIGCASARSTLPGAAGSVRPDRPASSVDDALRSALPASSSAPAAAAAAATAATAAGAGARRDAARWRALVEDASAPYRAGGRFAWHFARGKLAIDPVFRHLIGHGLIAPHARVLDIGCGQGLLASLLRAAAQQRQHADWPAAWGAAPLGCRVTGIELMPKDVQRARSAWQAAGAGSGADAVLGRAAGSAGPATGGADVDACADFICGDMRDTPFPASDVVVILDVLHYISVAEQNAVLARVQQALRPGGRLLLRVGDAAARRRFGISQWVDRLVFRARGHRATPLHGRPLADWTARLEALRFTVHAEPMSHGTPFANVLLVARLDAAQPADARCAATLAAGSAALAAAAVTASTAPARGSSRTRPSDLAATAATASTATPPSATSAAPAATAAGTVSATAETARATTAVSPMAPVPSAAPWSTPTATPPVAR